MTFHKLFSEQGELNMK